MLKFKASKLLSIFLIISCLFHLDEAKNTFCRNRLKKDDWVYCTKFGSSETSLVNVRLRAKFLNAYKKLNEYVRIEVGIYRDASFEEVTLSPYLTCQEKKSKAMILKQLEVPVDGSWSLNVNDQFYNTMLPKMYYFVVMDCEKNSIPSMPKIEVEFEMTNDIDGVIDHFSYEEQGMFPLHVVLLVIYSALFWITIYFYVQYQKMFENAESPHFIIILALFMHCCGIFMQCMHYWMYSYNGKGVPVFDIFGLIFFMLSEISFSSLLMMIAYGWTITYQKIDIDNNLEIYLPVGALVVVVHLVLAALTYVDIDALHKYHDYSGIQGWVLIVLKLLLFAYYMYCVQSNKNKIPKRSIEFYTIFTFLGSIYMLTIPMTILGSYFFQPYKRQFIYTMVTNFVQLFSACLMLQQQASTKSKYFYASLGAQGILPMDKVK